MGFLYGVTWKWWFWKGISSMLNFRGVHGRHFFWESFWNLFLLDLFGNLLKESWIIRNYRGHGEVCGPLVIHQHQRAPLLSGWFLPPFSGFPVGYDFSCPGGGYDCWGWNRRSGPVPVFVIFWCRKFHGNFACSKTWLVKKKVDFGSLFLKIQRISPRNLT